MYWWIRLAARLVVVFVIIALAFIVLEWALWFTLGLVVGLFLFTHRRKNNRYASKDQHYG